MKAGAGAATRGHGVAVAVAVAVITLTATGCTTGVDGTGQVDTSAVGEYRIEQSSSAAQRAQTDAENADYAACAAITSSVESMLRTYNLFVSALNAKQSYAELGGADLRSVDGFERGSAAISAALAGTVSAPIRTAAQQLVDRTGALVLLIRDKQRTRLNVASADWMRARDTVIGSCSAFASPTPSTTSAPPAGPSTTPGG